MGMRVDVCRLMERRLGGWVRKMNRLMGGGGGGETRNIHV